jgi:hypothetical protein
MSLLLVLAAILWQCASAAILVYEGFDYPMAVTLNGYGSNTFRWSTNLWTRDFASSDFNLFAGGLQFSNLPVNGGGIRKRTQATAPTTTGSFSQCNSVTEKTYGSAS